MAQHDKVRILLVDDKADTLLALEMILEDLHEEVIKAHSGKDALRWLLKDDFAVILLDVNMPGMDGFETAELIRQRKRSQHTPIIFLTAYSDEMYIARGYSLGAVDYILAPVVPEILRAKVAVFADLYRKTQQLKRQTESLEQRASQLHKLTEASLAITSAPSVEAIRPVLEEWARTLIGAERSSAIFEISENGATPGDSPVDSPPAGRETDMDLPGSIADRQGRIVVPLVGRSGQHMGILHVSDKVDGEMTDDDQAVLVQLARIASIAMENVISAHAREANRLKDQFLATLSHELRSPLNAILGWTKILRTDNLPAHGVTRALDVIERNVNAQAKLIEDLLDVSRIATGKMQLTMRPLFLAGVVQNVIDTLQPVALKHGVQLSFLLDASAELLGDADRLRQAVVNLLDNAIKFTPAGGRIEISLDRVDGMARLRVSDRGQGISPQLLPHVFDCFRQGDYTSTRTHGGLGIGLAVVKHIVQVHGGSVRAESPGTGQGATFYLELPLKAALPPSEIAPASDSSSEYARAQWLSDLNGLRIVLVDDDQDARDAIAEILQRCRAQVTSVGSAREALESIRSLRPDILISDIAMPHEDGYALIQAVRTLTPEEGGTIPAVALTAYASQSDRSRLLSAGFQMHLPKPIDPTTLPPLLFGLGGRTGSPPTPRNDSSSPETNSHG